MIDASVKVLFKFDLDAQGQGGPYEGCKRKDESKLLSCRLPS